MPKVRIQLAKLTAPQLHGALARTRLYLRLDEARGRPVISVIGPPGAGKTTLVASWLKSRIKNAIWYQIDAGDADVASFFHYFGIAAASAKHRSRLPAFAPEYRHDIAGFARRYFRRLGELLPANSVIVLDNLQDAGVAKSLHCVLVAAIAELPHGASLLTISREEYPEEFSRLVANRAISTIDWDELRLTLQETREIVEAWHPSMKASASALHEQSQGWAAGLTLMLERAAHTNQVEAINGTDTREETFRYFATQIFSVTAAADQQFLLRSALLPRMTVAMAAALTGDSLAGRRLESLHRRRLFIHRQEGKEAQYSYHSLFRQFLLSRAEAKLDAEELADLWKRSGEMLELSSQWEDAVDAHARGGHWDALHSLVEREASHLMDQGRSASLGGWILRMPQEQVQRSPWLQYWLATAKAQEDAVAALPVFEQANRLFFETGDTGGQVMALCGMIESIFFAATNHALMDPWIPVLRACMLRIDRYPNVEVELRAHAVTLISMLFRCPDARELEHVARHTLVLLDSAAHANQRMTAAVFLLVYCTFAGRFALAEVVVTKADALVAAGGISPHNVGIWSVWKCYRDQILYRPESGIGNSLQAEEIGRTHGLSHIVFLSRYFRSGIEAKSGDLAAAERSVALALAVVDPSRKLQVAQGNACSAWLAVYSNKPRLALEHGRLAMLVARELGSPSYRIHYGMPYLFGLIETGAIDEARMVLAEQRDSIRGTAIACFEPLLDCAEARIADVTGNSREARAIVSRMWAQARNEDRGPYLGWMATWMPQYAAWALEDEVESDYVAHLARHNCWKAPNEASVRWPWPVRIYTLGTFEVLADGHPLEFGRKAPKKPLAMLKAIVAAGGSTLPESRLVDMVWSDLEGDAASRSLDITLHRLRKWLRHSDAIRQKGGRISLNPDVCWVDAWHFERGARQGSVQEQVLQHYKGSFLPQDADVPWAMPYREKLRTLFVQGVSTQGKEFELAGNADMAIALYLRGIEADDLVEPFYQGLMRSYRQLGRLPEALSAYRRLKQTLSVTLGVQPAPASEQIYKSLRPA